MIHNIALNLKVICKGEGVITPPQDLQPAIDRLGPVGREFLDRRCEGRAVTAEDIAPAASHQRGTR